ncbi:MAG TPA: hypothetical protein VNS80_00390, partial [Pseudolysinimonas sp.]|nr:hypothetical protein [Pseudolysinimonas sp.]
MRALRPISLIAGVAAVALATLVVASPAAGATLPTGQRITVALPSGAFVVPPTSQEYTVSPADASGTAVGATAPVSPTAFDVDDAGIGYALAFDEDTDRPLILPFDANTGTYGAPVVIQVGILADALCNSIDYVPGTAVYIACNWEGDGSFVTMFGAVDPATGAFDVIADNEANGEEPTIEYSSIATNPVTHVTWVIYYDGSSIPYLMAPVDFAAEELGVPIPLTTGLRVFGSDFDRSGQLWASVQEAAVDPSANVLATINTFTGAVDQIAPYGFQGDITFNMGSITVWGALAATGSATDDFAPVGIGSALLLLAGAAFIATSRIQRRGA